MLNSTLQSLKGEEFDLTTAREKRPMNLKLKMMENHIGYYRINMDKLSSNTYTWEALCFFGF